MWFPNDTRIIRESLSMRNNDMMKSSARDLKIKPPPLAWISLAILRKYAFKGANFVSTWKNSNSNFFYQSKTFGQYEW